MIQYCRTIILSTFFMVFINTAQGDSLCPNAPECWCYNSGTALRAECSRSSLEFVPGGLPYNLTELQIRQSSLQTLIRGNLSEYSMLTELELISNEGFQIIQSGAFEGLGDLEKLNIKDNNLTSLSDNIFSATPKLKHIDISQNQLMSLPSFSLSGLETLLVPNNEISSIGSNVFSGCFALTQVDLSHNNIDSLSASPFSDLSRLTSLALDYNKIQSLESSVFAGLAALEYLTLQQNKIQSLPTNLFSGLSNVRELYLDKNSIESVDPEAFQGLTSLEILRLANNLISDIPTQALSRISSVRDIHLEGNPISEIPQNAFSGLNSLTGVFLGESDQLTEVHHGAFSGLPSLTTLSISSCPRLTNLTLDELPDDDLSKLRNLYISGNGFSYLDLATFHTKQNLTSLHLHTNPFHCSCALRWMSRVVEEDVVWARHWKESGTPPRCHTPSMLSTYRIPHMKEGDLTCDPPVSERVSEDSLEGYLRGTVEFKARLRQGLPESLWTTPSGATFTPIRDRPGGPGKLQADVETKHILQTSGDRHKAIEQLDPSDHSLLVTLEVSNLSLSDQGEYTVTATNIAGERALTFDLHVHPYELTTPRWTQDPETSSAMTVTWQACVLVASLFMMSIMNTCLQL